MNNLVYCVYGDKCAREALFSIMSAIRLEGLPAKDWRLLIYTDDPRPFARFDAAIERLDEQRLKDWAGSANFGHRRKICVLRHAISNYGRSVLVDSDTYFLRPPRRLFEKVSPGNAIMHMREALLRRFAYLTPLLESLCAEPFEVQGWVYKFTRDWLMWNSGIVGLDPADESLVERVIMLTDAIHERSPSLLSEQIAFTVAFKESTNLREADEIVYHYWPADLREQFQSVLRGLLEHFATADIGLLTERLYELRPRPKLKRRVKARAKEILFKAGWKSVGVRSSGL